jgi:mannose-6-phosphate isomerase
METDIRPWGHYEVLLDEPNYKVKRITVKPKQQLSYQYHVHRQESWTGVSGEAIAVVDRHEYPLRIGATVHIPYHMHHTIHNPSETHEFVFIEVQTGTYFGEDDIVRISDQYGRVEDSESLSDLDVPAVDPETGEAK